MREPKFRTSSAPRNRAPGHNPLSAAFNRYKNRGGPAIATLDEALDMLDHLQRRRAARLRRNEGVKAAPTKEQLFALSRAHAKSATKRGKIKMPTFSIQRHEIDA